MNGKSLISGIVVGSVIAGVSTLLTTPSSGESMRSKVRTTKEQAKLTFTELKSEAMQIKSNVSNVVEESKTVIPNVSKDLKTSLEIWQDSIRPHQENIQDNIALVEKEVEKLEKNLNKNGE
ncbi:YtxH domain-containing protein [Sutcliffiella deserti]|uniref:YtxH domain-containing protein n=1 Tax=Sutcliffiella deserti TaxID=2875501 RepID=UPI001CBBE139|nr:YtxH domain-containing protein [Sutcliffiella deserti]